MTILDLIRTFAVRSEMAILVTEPALKAPGPLILYANPAFERMSGYGLDEVIGQTPRMLQGAGTNREAARQVLRDLRSRGRFQGVLQNYRKSGEAYLCELDVHPVLAEGGAVEAFVAFEREVVRRRGRPPMRQSGRFGMPGVAEAD